MEISAVNECETQGIVERQIAHEQKRAAPVTQRNERDLQILLLALRPHIDHIDQRAVHAGGFFGRGCETVDIRRREARGELEGDRIGRLNEARGQDPKDGFLVTLERRWGNFE